MKKLASLLVGLVVLLSVLSLAGCAMGNTSQGIETPINSDSAPGTTPLVQSDPSENDFSIPLERGLGRFYTGTPTKLLVLMYHNFTTLTQPGAYDRNLTDFENDLIYLRDHNITVISLGDMLKIQQGKAPVPAGNIAVITIDDAYTSAYTRAFPLLKKYQVKATCFLITSFIGEPGRLTWKQVEEMGRYTIKNGKDKLDNNLVTFGSHTVDHNSLVYDPAVFASRQDYLKFLNMELNQSRKAIEKHTDQQEMFLSLPYGAGAYDADIINAAKRYGYDGIRTSEFGTLWGAVDLFTVEDYGIPSLPIFGDTNISTVQEHFDYLVF